MKNHAVITIKINKDGGVQLPADILKQYGLTDGARVRLDQDASGFRISRSTDNLSRIYIEPTNTCNLDCRTCMRNIWNEPPGRMSTSTFNKILKSLASISSSGPLTVFFGGFGEPLNHPKIYKMIEQVRRTGATTEIITNGILLSEQAGRRLIDSGLNRLWVSLDGATPESYADIRLGAALPGVIANLKKFKLLRAADYHAAPRLGIAFVAMKRNIKDLPGVIDLGRELGADRFSITNVLPHTSELCKEMLYLRSLYAYDIHPTEYSPMIALPRMDLNTITKESLTSSLSQRHLRSNGLSEFTSATNTCPFTAKGSVSIRWDGEVSPCLALMHTHQYYLDDRLRKSISYSVGNLCKNPLLKIWNSPAYISLRERLLQFDFSPCTYCNSCELANSNEEDCFGNVLPACGGCLWAQGFIQCP